MVLLHRLGSRHKWTDFRAVQRSKAQTAQHMALSHIATRRCIAVVLAVKLWTGLGLATTVVPFSTNNTKATMVITGRAAEVAAMGDGAVTEAADAATRAAIRAISAAGITQADPSTTALTEGIDGEVEAPAVVVVGGAYIRGKADVGVQKPSAECEWGPVLAAYTVASLLIRLVQSVSYTRAGLRRLAPARPRA